MKKVFTVLLLSLSFCLYSQCDSLQKELTIEQSNNKITIDFLSEKMAECDLHTGKLICQLQAARSEVIKQKTLKWIAFIGGAYICTMIAVSKK